jgi:urease accessory protein
LGENLSGFTCLPDLADSGLLRLLQLADSALPIGAAAHSCGLETLVAEGIVSEHSLAAFLESFLEESLALDAVFLRASNRLGDADERWVQLNLLLSARKPAREPRAASVSLGRRFLMLANELEPADKLAAALRATPEVHFATAFGLVAGEFGIPEGAAALAFLQQSVTGLVSAGQRLLPLGQTAASRLIWDLRPVIIRIAAESAASDPLEALSFAPLAEIGGMRHPGLETRLFVS